VISFLDSWIAPPCAPELPARLPGFAEQVQHV
jgi:hypothetical protein